MMSAYDMVSRILKSRKENILGNGHFTRAEILERLNNAQEDVSSEVPDLIRDEDTSLTTVTSQANYTIPVDVARIISIRIGGKQLSPLEQVDEETLDRMSQRGQLMPDYKTDEQGEPTTYYIRKGILYIFPTPVAAYNSLTITILHELNLTDLTDSASSFVLENQASLKKCQAALIWDTIKILAFEDGDFQAAGFAEGQFDKIINRLKSDKALKTRRPESLCMANTEVLDEEDGRQGRYEYR